MIVYELSQQKYDKNSDKILTMDQLKFLQLWLSSRNLSPRKDYNNKDNNSQVCV